MENIYKIKIRSDPSPGDLYPSERRYSSSIVLGLSVMFLALGATSILMGTLVVQGIPGNTTSEFIFQQQNESISAEDARFLLKIEKELIYQQQPEEHSLNTHAILASGSFVMSLGLVLAGLVGLLAWKQWYLDHNITWFFLACCFSSITSCTSLLLVALSIMDRRGDLFQERAPHMSLGLTYNILVTSLLALVWSVVASNVAFKGMKNNYPEDLVLSKGGNGRVQVNTVKMGNKIAKVVPPDILNDFPKSGKLAKFLAKDELDRNLPKAESNKEYEERVKKFLAGETETKN